MMMPLMTGAELIAALRADAMEAMRSALPMILMTAAGPAQAAAAGADAVLRKPFDVDQIETLLRRFLEKPKL